MKNGSKNKNRIIPVTVLAFLVLGGFAGLIFTPVLKNADKPFIDLSGSVGEAIGNAQSAYIAANPTVTPRPKATATPTPRPTSVPTPTPTPVIKDVEIVVADEEVNSEDFKSTDAAGITVEFTAKKIQDIKAEGRKVILVDDYAESKTFKKLLKLLNDSGLDYEVERRQQ
ncbi:MAG: hypothetical protein IJS80_06610 [Lachnospiraceae bacterium]|nr:hypothetical protein [Lachnospiraceae bacterium]